MTTEPFKDIIFLLPFIQGNAWPFSITWLKLNLQILLLSFYWCVPTRRLLLWKLFFQLIWNGYPQLEANSHFFFKSVTEAKLHIKKKSEEKDYRKERLKRKSCSFHVKLLAFVDFTVPLFVTLFPLRFVWSFPQSLAGGKSGDAQGDHPNFLAFSLMLLGVVPLAQDHSCWQLPSLILQQPTCDLWEFRTGAEFYTSPKTSSST